MSYQAKFYLVNSTPQETTLCEISHIYHLPEVCCIMIYLKVQILQTTFILNWTSSKWNGRNTESPADEMAMAESQNQLLMQQTKFLFPFHFIVLEIVSFYLLWGKALQLTTIATKYICWKNEWNWHFIFFFTSTKCICECNFNSTTWWSFYNQLGIFLKHLSHAVD